MSVISKLWRACLPPQRTFFLFHLVHLQSFAARALGMLLGGSHGQIRGMNYISNP
jgi:hypothetical protein